MEEDCEKKINENEFDIIASQVDSTTVSPYIKNPSLDNEEKDKLTGRYNNEKIEVDENFNNGQEEEIDLSNVFYDLKSPDIGDAEKTRTKFSKFLSFSACSTKLKDVGKISLNYQMYLRILKRMGVLFFILGVFSIYQIYYNSQGSKLKVVDAYIEIDLWNLNNQNTPTNINEFTLYEQRIIKFIIFDFLTILIYFVYLQYLAKFIRKLQKKHSKRADILKKYNENTLDIEDFTIMVLGLPPDIKEDEIKEKFDANNILNVIFVRDYGAGLKIYKEQHDIQKELDHLINLKKIYQNSNQISKYKDLEKKIKIKKTKLENAKESVNNFNKNKKNLTHEMRFPIIRAFVVFSSRKVRNRIIKIYSPLINLLSVFNIQSDHFSLQRTSSGKVEKINIKVFAADSPNSINWEQIKHHRSLVLRFLIFVSLFIVILFVSYESVYLVKKYFSQILKNEKCSNINDELPLAEAQKLYTTFAKRFCYCKNQLFAEMKNNSKLKDYCSEFIKDLSLTMMVRFGFGIIVWLTNFGMKKIVKIWIEIVYHSGKNKRELLIVTCLFPIVLINMGVVAIVLNVSEKVFTKEWYSSSGNTLVSAMILGILTSHLEYIIYYILGHIKRNFCLRKFKSQGELNRRFKAHEFELANRYALMLIVVCICYMHAGGLPFLNIICCISLFVQYWIDKWLMFSYNTTPTIHNKFIGHRIILLLHFPLLIHCIEFYFIYHSALIYNQDMDKNEKPQNALKILIGLDIFVLIFSSLSLLKQFFKLKLRSCKKNEVVAINDRNLSLEAFLFEQSKKYDVGENKIYSKLTRESECNDFSTLKSVDRLINRI
ncbi:hypothetical protein SteCoe_25664 [Stentor coeruleus]|uniref:RRM domain-containing protein n=1 Tax=Stentor coeruleus TaxID=5963 RepID=A0A1R2BEY5_9CILI|nr:hypothetical protein SteCoe_25664 [Stentor coeruleus]